MDLYVLLELCDALQEAIEDKTGNSVRPEDEESNEKDEVFNQDLLNEVAQHQAAEAIRDVESKCNAHITVMYQIPMCCCIRS
jgi:hypothetical protein